MRRARPSPVTAARSGSCDAQHEMERSSARPVPHFRQFALFDYLFAKLLSRRVKNKQRLLLVVSCNDWSSYNAATRRCLGSTSGVFSCIYDEQLLR
jgi:hypothetical protein